MKDAVVGWWLSNSGWCLLEALKSARWVVHVQLSFYRLSGGFFLGHPLPGVPSRIMHSHSLHVSSRATCNMSLYHFCVILVTLRT